MALSAGEVYEDASGIQLTITSQYDPANSVGSIYAASAAMGALQSSILVTEAGLQGAGFTLVP